MKSKEIKEDRFVIENAEYTNIFESVYSGKVGGVVFQKNNRLRICKIQGQRDRKTK